MQPILFASLLGFQYVMSKRLVLPWIHPVSHAMVLASIKLVEVGSDLLTERLILELYPLLQVSFGFADLRVVPIKSSGLKAGNHSKN